MAHKSLLFVVGVVLFLATLAASQAVITYSDLYITVKDIDTNEAFGSKPIELIFTNVNTGTTINLTEFTNQLGVFNYRLNIGNWKLVTKLDKPITPEVDYWSERTFLVEENNPTTYETLYMSPVGAVEGSVVNPSGKLISNADLTFKCKSYKTSSKTDQFGSFKQDLLPVGQCKVQAAFGDFVGSSLVNVSQGELSQTVVHLNKTLFSSSKAYVYIIIEVILSAGLIFILYRLIKKRARESSKKEKKAVSARKRAKARKQPEGAAIKAGEKEEKTEEELNPRARDIMKTLNEREKGVVDFLLTQEGYKSTQATIRNDTGIPKTSIVRIFQSLEAKKVLKIEVIGKLKKVELTAWFLGKE